MDQPDLFHAVLRRHLPIDQLVYVTTCSISSPFGLWRNGCAQSGVARLY